MAVEFGVYATGVAAKNTPLGKLTQEFYDYRKTVHPYYADGPGMAQGGWDVYMKVFQGGDIQKLSSGIRYQVGIGASTAAAEASLDTNYQLGKKYYIYNKVPYMTQPNGIPLKPVDPTGSRVLQPTVQEVMQILGTDLVAFYNRG